MRVVIQRVSEAKVDVEGKTTGKINRGILIYSGIEDGDTEKEVEYIAEKIVNLRIFPDENNKMNNSIMELDNSEVLSISQFTLSSYIKKGRRPDFTNAMVPEKAKELYEVFNSKLAEHVKVEKGIFGAMMDIYSVNDGPVTFIIEKKGL
ncbi:MAG: D-aminoacyl-tRNA deacylase [Acidobacteriota bacterium]